MATTEYGPGYIRTTQGILKILELVLNFIGLLLVAIKGWSEDLQNAYIVGAVFGLIIALVLVILHVTKLGQPIEGVLAFQLYFNFLWFIYMLVVSSVLLSRHYNDKFQAGGAFGIIIALLYLADTVDCYRLNATPLFCFSS